VGGQKGRVKEGEYGESTLYSCMKIDNKTCWNCSKEGEEGIKEKDGEGESKIYRKHL
jgi:hypothetical protein